MRTTLRCLFGLLLATVALQHAATAGPEEPAPRTVERVEDPCKIVGDFRLQLINPANPANALDTILVADAQPELRVVNKAQLGIQVRIRTVAPYPGTLSFSFVRTAQGGVQPGTRGPFDAADPSQLKGKLAAEAAVLVQPPPKVLPGLPVIEDLIATATWTPNGHKKCALPEKLRVIWDYAHGAAAITWTPPQHAPGGKTAVSIGKTIGKEGKWHTIPTQTYFVVKDVTKCCDVTRGYAVIQFVRRVVHINETPSKSSLNNDWNLDVIDSEVKRAAAGESYDPTFTHDPRGTNPSADPIVYPGPDPAGFPAIVQVDRPGIETKLFDRLSKSGGSFTWQFHAFLVCMMMPGDAAAYLAQGQVVQEVSYQIVVTFPGAGAMPVITGKSLSQPPPYKPCASLKNLLEALDRKTKAGKYIDAYQHPADHTIAFPH